MTRNSTMQRRSLTELVSIPRLGEERPAVECLLRELDMYGAETTIDGAGNGIAVRQRRAAAHFARTHRYGAECFRVAA